MLRKLQQSLGILLFRKVAHRVDLALLGKLDEVLQEEWEVSNPYEGLEFDNPVDQILAHPDFKDEDPRVIAAMRFLYEQGSLAGTGQVVVLPIDQGLGA